MTYTTYKDIINSRSDKIEELYKFFKSEPLSVTSKVEQAFEDRCGYVRLRLFEDYVEVNGWVHNGYTIYRILHFRDDYDLRALAEDLIIADYRKGERGSNN